MRWNREFRSKAELGPRIAPTKGIAYQSPPQGDHAPREPSEGVLLSRSSPQTLQDEPAEVFAILCLSTKNRVIAYHEVSRGALDVLSTRARCTRRAACQRVRGSLRRTTICQAIRHRRRTTPL
jgi:hypothetical protein